jgi:hypothetical protein
MHIAVIHVLIDDLIPVGFDLGLCNILQGFFTDQAKSMNTTLILAFWLTYADIYCSDLYPSVD